MGKLLISTTYLMLILSCVESCFLLRSLYVIVPEIIPPGYQVAKVETVGCDAKSVQLTVKDPSLTIKSNGAVVALTSVSVGEGGRIFSVSARDNSGLERKMEVHLVRSTMPKRHVGPYSSDRRYWYFIEGEGVDTYPTGVFSIERDTGDLFLLKAVDREEFPAYNILMIVFDKHTNAELDEKIPLRVIVDDVNDNAPEFVGPLHFTVPEHCSAGTVVGVVSATDRDQIGTDHVKIKYTLVSGSDMFTIHPETGVITTTTNTLDRELKDNHVVTVKIQDMNGAPSGLFATSTATIALSDINDNPPTFMKSTYNVTVQEDESEKLLLRIPVQDKDLINTSNWMSKFVITKGNENGNFRIVTDPQTNEGLLYISKPLDYEKTNDVQLQITAQNVASLNGSSATWQSIPVNVNVEKVDAVRAGLGQKISPGILTRDPLTRRALTSPHTPTTFSQLFSQSPGREQQTARSVSFGLLGIMTILCPVVLLLLLFPVLAFFCLKKREKLQLYDSGDTGGIPLKSNTEAPEDSMTDAKLLQAVEELTLTVTGLKHEIQQLREKQSYLAQRLDSSRDRSSSSNVQYSTSSASPSPYHARQHSRDYCSPERRYHRDPESHRERPSSPVPQRFNEWDKCEKHDQRTYPSQQPPQYSRYNYPDNNRY
ncbi:desmocollin-2-like isoform X2 [Astatotilapia calliptera]|uniref:desmocollin-2-like isoform X2 n=1 Tax=Astatotilapia calliptera TaxID=8154 RepID=UPI000E426544|nr:desmocollin-2-like isoform X2 [Astatotilapia calliptera]